MGATSFIWSDESNGNGPLHIFDIINGRDIIAVYDDGTEVFAFTSDGFIRTTTGWKGREAGGGLGDFDANGNTDAQTFPLLRCKHDVTITDVNIGTDATVTADTTDYVTFTLEQSLNSTDIGTLTTATTDFTIHQPRAFTISSTNNTNKLAAGSTLSLRSTMNDSGVAVTGLNASIGYTIDQPNATTGNATDNYFRIINDIGTSGKFGGNAIQREFLHIRQNGVVKLRIDSAGKMHGTAPDQYYYQVCNVGPLATADSGTKKSPLWTPHSNCTIVNAYFGASDTVAADSQTTFWQVKLTDATNILADIFIEGPYGGGTALTKGVLYDMGDINPLHAQVTNSTKVTLEYLETGTGSPINGLTVVLVYQKTS